MPRYEFRIFGTCPGMAEQRLRSLLPCYSISESRRGYLLGEDASSKRNINIRDGKLEELSPGEADTLFCLFSDDQDNIITGSDDEIRQNDRVLVVNTPGRTGKLKKRFHPDG